METLLGIHRLLELNQELGFQGYNTYPEVDDKDNPLRSPFGP